MVGTFLAAVFVVAVLSGATASVVGFGIGSLLTPLIALRYGMPTAVAFVAVPHAAATALRCWRLRAAALSAFNLTPVAFVATSAAIGALGVWLIVTAR